MTWGSCLVAVRKSARVWSRADTHAGKPPQHKLLPVEARQAFVYEKHASAEAALWEEEFHEPLWPNRVK